MYTIIYANRPDKTIHCGQYPAYDFLQEELNAGKHLIVISTYSDTIKVPFFVVEKNPIYSRWEFRDFPLA